jgi:hypothetical protein
MVALIALRQTADSAASDAEYIFGQERVYGDTAERRVEWDIFCGIAERRKEKAWTAYKAALSAHVQGAGELDETINEGGND